MRKKKTFLLILILSHMMFFFSCETGLVDDNGMTPSVNSQENHVILLEGNLSSQATSWKYAASNIITIPDYNIDSIIFQAPLRSVNEIPGGQAILFDNRSGENINSSLVTSTVRYTIENKRSLDLKGYFKSGDYSIRVGLRSQSAENPAEVPYEAKLIIYYKY